MVEPYQLLDTLPEFSKGAKIIGLDTETEDQGLGADMGPGALRGQGKLLGVGVTAEYGSGERFKHYFPIGHEDGRNYDPQIIIPYLNDQLGTDIPKVGANIPYDMEWSYVSGINVKGPIRDVQIAEPMLDEERPGGYSLEALAQSYLGVGKDEQLLRVAADKYGVKVKKEKDIKKHLKLFAPEYVAPYCITDSELPIDIYKKQIPLIQAEDMWDIFMIESKLIPIFFEMKKFGVRVDVKRAEQLSKELTQREERLMKLIRELSGMEIDCWSNVSIETYFKQAQLPYKLTAAGNPSFEGEDLAKSTDKVCQLMAEWRKVNTMKVRYVEDILKYEYNGRIHSAINQLAKDDEKSGGKFGTVSGRLSYAHINLQKIPKRDEEWRRIIRSMFLPEEGCFWGQQDYSQQEPRLGVHYASLRRMPGAAGAVDYYHQPGACFHTMVAEMAGIDRNKKAKPLNLGSWYGMGLKKMLIDLGGDTPENRDVFKKYHETFPFVKALLKDCMRYADNRGWVKTILGRRAHFREVVPWVDWDTRMAQVGKGFLHKPTRMENIPLRIKELQEQIEAETDIGEFPKNEALIKKLENDIKLWESGRYERVGTYKALNRIIQGSAADQTKKSILDIYEHYGHVRFTQIQVHDELDGSYERTEDLVTVKEMMQNAITLKVPVVVEPEIGPSWGEVQKWKAS